MRIKERIPLHNHEDSNSGGAIHAPSIVLASGVSSTAASAGSSSLTISDEGVALSTPAASVNFVGDAVTASGTTAAKTVTVAAVLPTLGGKETISNHGTTGSTETIDLVSGNYHYGTLDANCTFTFTGATTGTECSFTLELTENGTGGYSPTWPGSVVWPGGTTPTHTTTAGSTTLYVFGSRDGGTTWYGFQAGAGASLTVKDEGGALASAATSLDFVGAGVVASGTGAAKTITISGAPTGAAGGDLTGTYPNPSISTAAIAAAVTVPFTVIGQEQRTSDGSTTAWTLDNDFEEFSVSARNLTTGHVLSVTETLPNTATISAAGTAGDVIAFGYAASVI